MKLKNLIKKPIKIKKCYFNNKLKLQKKPFKIKK